MKTAIILCKRYIDVVKALGGLAADCNRQGQPLVIFCEDKLSLSAEKAVTAALASRGSFDISVTTFARYLSKRGGRLLSLSKEGSVMAVKKILYDRAVELKYLKKCSNNTAVSVYELIAQLKSAKISPGDLKAFAGGDRLLKNKIDDISLIFSAYEQFLSGGLSDESGYLELLPGIIENDAGLKNARVALAGFSSFTRQARIVLEKLIEVSPDVLGIFCGGDGEIYTNEAAAAFLRVCDEKALTCKVKNYKGDMPFECGLIADKLFDPAVFKPGAKPLTERVFLYEADALTDEIKFMCERILFEIKENGLRYRDITVVCNQNAELLLKRYLGEYQIPCFLDAAKELLTHPLPRFIITLLKNISGDFALENGLDLVKNIIFSPDKNLTDRFENYVLKHENRRGFLKQKFENLDENTQIFEDLRQNALSLLIINKKDTAAGYCQKLLKILEQADVLNGARELTKRLGAEDSAAAAFNEQALSCVISVLEEIKNVIPDMQTDTAEFTEILTAGFAAKKISLIPPSCDAVTVGGYADHKITGCKALFCIGLNSDVPLVKSDTALISDRDITLLSGFSLAIEPKIQAVNMRSRENAGIITASFDQRLYLSYSMQGEDGGELRRSEIVTYIKKLFSGGADGLPTLTREHIEAADGHFNLYNVYRYASRLPALKSFIADVTDYKYHKKDSLATPSAYYAAVNQQDKQQANGLLSRAEMLFTNRISRSKELCFKNGLLSATLLQSYFDCPYKCFLRHSLKLKEREAAEVKPIDCGNFLHLLLERAEGEPGLKTKAQIERFCNAQSAILLEQPPYFYMTKNPSSLAALKMLTKEAARIISAMAKHKEVTDFKTTHREYKFGGEGSPPLSLKFGGKEYALGGIVDRLDSADGLIRIVDYKSGKVDKKDIAANYYSGKRLQLWLYLNACKRLGKPCGGYYFDLNDDYTEDEGLSNYKMTGMTLADPAVLEKTDKSLSGGEALSVNIQLKKGEPSGEILPPGDFEQYLSYAPIVAAKAAAQIEEGIIAPSPAGDCGGCAYKGVCGYSDCFLTARAPFAASPKQIASAAKDFFENQNTEKGG